MDGARPIRLNASEEEELRRQGHAIPRVVELERKSTLDMEQRVYVVKRVYTIRKLMLPFLMRSFPDQDAMETLRDVLRSQCEDCEDTGIALPTKLASILADPKKCFDKFLPYTYGVRDGRDIDGEFHAVFMMLTSELTSPEFIQCLTRNMAMEHEYGHATARHAWDTNVAPRLEEGKDLWQAGAKEATRIEGFKANLVAEAKAMATRGNIDL